MLKVIKELDFGNVKIIDCHKRRTLNFTDIINNNNKYYNLEILETNRGWILFTQYGRVGGTAAKEYRSCDDQYHAESEGEKIIKSKLKKGYVEVKLAKSDVGSEVGKTKVDNKTTIEALQKAGVKIEEKDSSGTPSKLHPEVQGLVRTWFGVTQEFIDLNLDTKKCPLGQLSLDQIAKGKDILDEARKIIHMSKPDIQELNGLTNQYYSNIPHNFGYTRLNADVLRLDTDEKVDKAFDIMDVLLDAKNVQTVISKKSAVDSQYATLNAELEWLDPSNPTWKWIETMVHETRAHNHGGLGKIKVHKIFKLKRNNEEKNFLTNAERIAKECGKSNLAKIYAHLVKKRPDVIDLPLYMKANIAPGWHGTRRANMIGIITKGLLIRPSGVTHAGSMYGNGIYWAPSSSKSCNYVDVKGSYWASGGAAKTGWLFLSDVAFGNQKLAKGSYMYSSQNIKPCHSVWAKAGDGGVINDEMITYTQSGPAQQHYLRYIIEFETQAK